MQVIGADVPQAPPAPFEPGTLPPWETLPPQVTLLIAMAMVLGAVLLLAPLLKALAKRIEGGGAGDRALRRDVTDLKARLDEIEARALGAGETDAADHRFYQIEERVEFVERLLSRGKDTGSVN